MWVLFLVVTFSSNVAVTSAVFATEEHCRTAGASAEAELTKVAGQVAYSCSKRYPQTLTTKPATAPAFLPLSFFMA